jgi:cyclase
MLKVRVIPTLLWKNFGLVKGVAFDSWRRVGSVLPAIKVYNAREVDELILLDITATLDVREPDYESISDFADECFVPFTIGGGIQNTEQIYKLLRSGADKVCINSAAYSNPRLINDAAQRFGSQCVTVSIDARCIEKGVYKCFSHSGTRPVNCSPVDWAREVVDRGAGEVLITSMDMDGTMLGYDLELIAQVVHSVNVPVIASGGAGNFEDMRRAIQEAGASALAAASMFHFTEQTPLEVKKYLSEAGIAVRRTY